MVRKLFAGKRGVVDDLFDMLFIVIVIFFGVFFMYYVFASSAAAKEEASISTVYSAENEQILLQLLQTKISYNSGTYTGAEFILFTLHNKDQELLQEKFSELMVTGRIVGSLIVYNGQGSDSNEQFALAQGEGSNLWDDEPASITLENPENSNKYLIEFYGEKE